VAQKFGTLFAHLITSSNDHFFTVRIRRTFVIITTGNHLFIVSVIIYSNCHILQFLHKMFDVFKCSMCPPCCWTAHSHVTVLLQIFSWFSQRKKFKIGLYFMKFTGYKKCANFWATL